MANVGEINDPTQQQGILRDGLRTLDLSQVVTFQAYTKVILPVDGFVFWSPVHTLDVPGSLHYSQETIQNEDETYGSATVIFTAEDQVTEFANSPVGLLYVATVDGFRFAFSQQQGFYKQADLWHYVGYSVQPALASQLLDRPDSIDITQAVTSNSLALWLGLNNYKSIYYDGFTNTGVPFFVAPPTLYPSQLVQENKIPPYGSIYIGDNDTNVIQSTPLLDINRSHSQLVTDNVRIILYGLQHKAVMDFIDTVNQYSLDTDNFGIMNMPVVRDGIRNQKEILSRAMKKVIDFQVSYYQNRLADVTRALIKHASDKYIVERGAL